MAKNKEVIKINAHRYQKMEEVHQKTDKLRVAAYARVSTELDNQTHSLIAQKCYYTKLIKENEDWEFAGLFADEGLSGTSFNKRLAFLEMIEKVEKGEIDFIITKSISRFARNTVDTLTTIRKLKTLGVGIWFEKENVNTLDSKGEFIITLMSSLAQDESRSISENVTWGQRKRFSDGKATMPFSRCLGYDRGPNGEFVINQEQAKVVKAMFAMAVLGMTTAEIKKKLNEMKIPTASGNKWDVTSGIKNMLLNEKYVGDALLQKSFTVDYLSKKNEG
ncbi:recombinase family protein [Lactococcus petauri]|uniref:recombinase family protein n=1 Tax=Lactococcus petauri TaxID=1940789 RepID=UPI003853B130